MEFYGSALCITLSGGILESERSGIFIFNEVVDYFDIFCHYSLNSLFLSMEIESIIKETVKILRKYLSGEYQIFLFGSFVEGNALPSSDIDIGILGEEKIPWSVMTKILEEIDSIKTLRKIDLVDFFTKEETFKINALKSARKLYE